MLTCNIVKDLLPNYIDGLTGEETNKEITEHIENCADCRAVYVQMKAPVLIDAAKEKRKVNYLKKIKKRSWRNIAIACGGFALIFAVFLWISVIGVPASSDEIEHHPYAYNWKEWEEREDVDIDYLYTWSVDVSLKDRSGKYLTYSLKEKLEKDKDGEIISKTIILTPRICRPKLQIGDGNFVHGVRLAENATYETIYIIRFSDKDIIFAEEDMRGSEWIDFEQPK